MVSTRNISSNPASGPAPRPAPRPQVAYPNAQFQQISDLATNLWIRREIMPDGTPQCQNIRDLINDLIHVGDITVVQGNNMLNAVNALEHFDWINNNINVWQDAWYAFRQTLGEAGCPGAYFVLLEEEFMP
jgi:hypothetical protein